MNRKIMLTILIIAIMVIAVLAYMFTASSDFEFSFGKGSSVSSQEDQEFYDAADYISEDEEVDIGNVV